MLFAAVMALCVMFVTAGCTTAATSAQQQPASQPAMLDGTSSADLDAAVARIREFTDFQPGTLMCIEDHIASFVPSPLIGPNDSELGDRFLDMSQVYDPELSEILHSKADELNITLHDDMYLQVIGPAYETPAEARLYATLARTPWA